ncbi:UNVERIFIED_ORG: hypothetical protein J2W82_005234 [Pseudomonas mohnii]|jgi:hypothetical protein|nr:hypothetical protein [Pseudomonas mohnii]
MMADAKLSDAERIRHNSYFSCDFISVLICVSGPKN